MIPYSGLLFFYILALFLIPAVVLGLWERPLRVYGLLFSITMLVIVFGENSQLFTLLLFYFWQTGLCMGYLRLRQKRRYTLWLAVVLALLPLGLVKVGEIWKPLGFFRLLGISYMTFRSVQVLLDLHDGRLKSLRLVDFSYFLLFFPSVASGPIDRYQRFTADLEKRYSREDYAEMLRFGVWRLVTGAASAMVIGGMIQSRWLAALPSAGFWPTVLYMYGYTFYLYFNFSGCSSMAIGTAAILGISLPENFHLPFLSLDMKDFWNRWHITLSTWLRDYLYYRFVRRSLKAKHFKNPRTASYLGYLLNMMVMGLWHGLTLSYIVYGFYHGVLLCINEALDLHWKGFRRLKQHPWGQLLLVAVTFHLFSFGLLIFSGRLLG